MAPTPAATVHTVFTSECNNVQFDWFATGVFESFRTSGMRGKITRLLACSPEELAKYKGMDIGPTFVHPNYRHNPINGDTSASYNKPASVMHFSRESNFTEDYLLFIDADMLLCARRPCRRGALSQGPCAERPEQRPPPALAACATSTRSSWAPSQAR